LKSGQNPAFTFLIDARTAINVIKLSRYSSRTDIWVCAGIQAGV